MTKLSKSNESALGSAIDLFNDLRSIATKPDKAAELISRHRKNTNPYIRSISSASQDLICAFPVISSRNISMDAQILVSKAIEKNCVSMLQMIFAANQVYNANDVDGIRDILSKYHVNLSKNTNAVDMDDIVRLISNESGSISDMGFVSNPSMIHEGTNIPYSVSYEAKKQLNNLNEVLGPDVNTKSIGESYSCVTDSQGRFKVSTQPRRMYTEANKEQSDNSEDQLTKNNVNQGVLGNGDAIKGLKDKTDMLSKQILPSEYKKANELAPTMMVINYNLAKDNYAVRVDNAIIGVKAKLYPLSSEDIVSHLVSKTRDSNTLMNLIRVSTGEISFFKDFLLAIDKNKAEALTYSKKGSANKLWKVLERRANKSKLNAMLARKNDATAITTLVISQNEVDYMKKEYNVDFDQIKVVRNLFDKYNLLCVCIVDESLEIAKFMYDTGDDMWETLPFSALEKEASDNTYKKVVNLMTKVM